MTGGCNNGITHKETQATCTNCNLLSPDSAETEFFKITTGVLQGYTLAPYLLIIVLDYVVRYRLLMDRRRALDLNKKASKDKVTEFRPKKSLNLKVANNIALFSGQFQQEQELLRNVEELPVNVGLLPNAKKTK